MTDLQYNSTRWHLPQHAWFDTKFFSNTSANTSYQHYSYKQVYLMNAALRFMHTDSKLYFAVIKQRVLNVDTMQTQLWIPFTSVIQLFNISDYTVVSYYQGLKWEKKKCQYGTSNVNGRHRGPKWKLWAGYRAPSLQRTSFFIIELLRAFSALWVYSKFEHHPHPLGYLCAKFHFFRDLHSCARPRRTSSSAMADRPRELDQRFQVGVNLRLL